MTRGVGVGFGVAFGRVMMMTVCGDGVASTLKRGSKPYPMLPMIVWTNPENAMNATEHNTSEYFSRLVKSGGGVVMVNLCRAPTAKSSRVPYCSADLYGRPEKNKADHKGRPDTIKM